MIITDEILIDGIGHIYIYVGMHLINVDVIHDESGQTLYFYAMINSSLT
jgi:hypothetical protein